MANRIRQNWFLTIEPDHGLVNMNSIQISNGLMPLIGLISSVMDGRAH